MIFQNVWGIKAFYKNKFLYEIANKKEQYGIFGINNKNNLTTSRIIIGKSVITNIETSIKINNIKNLSTEIFLKNFNTLTFFNVKK